MFFRRWVIWLTAFVLRRRPLITRTKGVEWEQIPYDFKANWFDPRNK